MEPDGVAAGSGPNLGAGYLLAVLLPVVGLVYGLWHIRRGGERVVLVSLLAGAAWWLLTGLVT